MIASEWLAIAHFVLGAWFAWTLRSAMRDPQQPPYVIETKPLTALERKVVEAVIAEYDNYGYSSDLTGEVVDAAADVVFERDRNATNEG